MQGISQVVLAVLVVHYLVSYISRQKERVRWFQYYGVYGMRFVLCPATYFQLSSVRVEYKTFFQEF